MEEVSQNAHTADSENTLSKDALSKHPLSKDALTRNGLSGDALSHSKLRRLGLEERKQADKTLPYDPSQEPIFPPFLKASIADMTMINHHRHHLSLNCKGR